MAIMERCCCFTDVRSGSTASGIYSMIISGLNLAYWAWQLAAFVKATNNPEVASELSELSGAESITNGVYAAYSIDIIVAVFLFISSIILLVGISWDIKEMLIPYMASMVLLLGLQVIAWIIIFVLLGLAGFLLIGSLVIWLLFTALNITCLLCVISQYQEYRDGRGRAINNTV